MPNGDQACNFSIAVGKKWRDKQSGETKEQTTWVTCSCFGKTAELLGQYGRKGGQIRVNGELSVRKYNDKDGIEKQITEIRVQDFQLLGSRDDAGQQGGGQQRQAAAPQQRAAAPARQSAPLDDDIPF